MTFNKQTYDVVVLQSAKKTTNPIFNDTPELTRKWLLENNQFRRGLMVFVGKTLKFVTVSEYLGEK